MNTELRGQVAFVTGAASGIGLGIARACAQAGMKVVLADIDETQLARAAQSMSGEILPLRLDVTDRKSWAAAKTAALQRFGAVDLLCNNAGISPNGKPLADVAPEALERVIAVNVLGVFNGIAAFASTMRERRCGHIVNTSSIAGMLPDVGPVPGAVLPPEFGLGDYGASKFAVVAMSESLRRELAPFGVGVSVLCPGTVESRMTQAHPEMFRGIRLMDPLWVGRAVLKAVRENRLYIFTHPEYRSLVQARFDAILDSFGEPAEPGYTSTE